MTELAKRARMSPATFQRHCKTVTAASPLQYLNKIRLHRARLMMVHSGLTAGNAATAVGYQSSSQFGREFKRLFGRSPLDEANSLKARLSLEGQCSSNL